MTVHTQTAPSHADFRTLIDRTPMSAYQWLIVGVACFVNALDGYDLVAMAFTATPVSEEFVLSASHLGWLLSSALIGIAIGAVILAPLADRLGRKRLIVVSLLINLLGLILTNFAGDATTLFIYRVITGIGVGGVLACATVLTSEFSNLRFRGLAMAIYAAGYGLGATLCGVLANGLVPTYGWRAIFVTGAALTAVALLVVLWLVPETPEALATHQGQDAVQQLAVKLKKAQPGEPVQVRIRDKGDNARVSELLAPEFWKKTLLLWLAFGLVMLGFNFASQWTPKLLEQAGLDPEQSVLGGIMLMFGGTIGSLAFGLLTTRFTPRAVLIGFSGVAAVVLVAFISSTSFPALMFVAGVAVGMLLNGCVTGIYTVTPQSYPFRLRGTGVGVALGVSRFGAILGPVLVGYLVDNGWTPVALYVGCAGVMILTMLAILALQGPKRRTPKPSSPVQHAAKQRA